MNLSTQSCFHCGLPVPDNTRYSVRIQGKDRPMCCPGCEAVAKAIVDNGLQSFYDYRTERSAVARQLVPDELNKLELYDRPDLQKSFVYSDEAEIKQASLILEGIVCAACVWLSERHVTRLPGVISFQVNYSTHRATLKWDNARIKLSDVLKAISDIGYIAHPLDPNRQEQLFKKERAAAIRRLAVAGFGAMQVMMLAVALYAGAAQGMDTNLELFLRWVSLLIATPVLMYSARPFFTAAWRDLKMRAPGMDVPVALAIGGAFLASLWATITRSGEIYFDSVTMFTFFLLLGRFLEMTARQRAGRAAEELVKLLPAMALRVEQDRETLVAVSDLQTGDTVIVKPGETIPADGVIVKGTSSVDESLLTGESLPLRKTTDSSVIGGSVNIESPLYVRVTQVGQDTVLAAIQRLLERAQSEKPRLAQLADKVAGYFVIALLIIAATVGTIWWQIDAEHAFWVVISVLVVTCPCALSLATPTALTAATGRLTRQGMLTTRGHALETLARVNHVVFDKTGTLTHGKLTLSQIQNFSDLSEQQLLSLAASLESHSEHPIARAIVASSDEHIVAEDIQNIPGQGISATIDGQRYLIGSETFMQSSGLTVPTSQPCQVYLADSQSVLAGFVFSDRLRSGARELIEQLHAMGIQTSLLSGDRTEQVQDVASRLTIPTALSGLLPQDKLAKLKQYQQHGDVVAMVGDGVNDAPVLSQAQVSIAMGEGTQIAHASADMVLLSNDLAQLANSIQVARQTRTIIKQNLAWALLYNVVALPLAASGWVAPWMAAIGMSTSSLVVVLNALRLTARPQRRNDAVSSNSEVTA